MWDKICSFPPKSSGQKSWCRACITPVTDSQTGFDREQTAESMRETCWVAAVTGGTLTVVRVDEMRSLRGVVDELDLADLPHLSALVTSLLQRAHTQKQASRHTGFFFSLHGFGTRVKLDFICTGDEFLTWTFGLIEAVTTLIAWLWLYFPTISVKKKICQVGANRPP